MSLYSMEGLPKVKSRKCGSHQKVNVALVAIETLYIVVFKTKILNLKRNRDWSLLQKVRKKGAYSS